MRRTTLWGLGSLLCLTPAIGAMAQSSADAEPRPAAEILDVPEQGRFVFLRENGARVFLQASSLYAASVSPFGVRDGVRVTPPPALELAPQSARPDLVERGVTLFRVPDRIAPRGLDEQPLPDAWRATLHSDARAQPVFEHGAALRIATSEVIVAFDPDVGLEQARLVIDPLWSLFDVREIHPGTFAGVLREPCPGCVFKASRVLSTGAGVRWSEPSFVNVFLETPGGPPDVPDFPFVPNLLVQQQPLGAQHQSNVVMRSRREPEDDAWHLVLDGHFEDDSIGEWTVFHDPGAVQALPFATRYRAHDGNRSVLMTGAGLAANKPPNPYATGASSYLVSPAFGAASFHDVFVELWFSASFETPRDAPRIVHDFGRVMLYDPLAQEIVAEFPLAPVGTNGDLTRGPGTDRGWRKLLFRVPHVMRARPLQLIVHFASDGADGALGLFVDDIRVLGTELESGPRSGRDPAAEKQYALMPHGQVAGRPVGNDPSADGAAAWSFEIFEQRDTVVALLDDGIERAPDLTFWKPARSVTAEPTEDGDATEELPPAEPVSPDDRHGTACAGVLGAIANDGVGFAGVAPGTLLLPLLRGADDISLARAIDTAVALGAHVLVLPWGFSGAAPQVVTRAIEDAIGAGMIVVAAAGDGVHRPYDPGVDYPCSMSTSTSLICVGASGIAGETQGPATADGQYWWTSAADASGPDILAPGTWLHTTDRRGAAGYNDGSQSVPADWTDAFGGTGAAACYAGGVLAQMASVAPGLTPPEAKALITLTATAIPGGTAQRPSLKLVSPPGAVRAAVDAEAARVARSAVEAVHEDDAVGESDAP